MAHCLSWQELLSREILPTARHTHITTVESGLCSSSPMPVLWGNGWGGGRGRGGREGKRKGGGWMLPFSTFMICRAPLWWERGSSRFYGSSRSLSYIFLIFVKPYEPCNFLYSGSQLHLCNSYLYCFFARHMLKNIKKEFLLNKSVLQQKQSTFWKFHELRWLLPVFD